MFSLVNAAKDEDPKLAGLLPYYEEGETGGRVGRSGGRSRGPRKGKVEQVKELNGQGNVRNRNGNMIDEDVQRNVRNAFVDNNQVGCQLVTLRSMMVRDVL